MTYLKTLTSVILLGGFVLLYGCTDLSVDNLNDPATEQVMGNAEDMESFMGGQFYSWWNGLQKYDPALTISTMANELTSSWGNFRMNDMSSFPRTAFVNDPAYSNIQVIEVPWSNLYTAISSVNDVLRAIHEEPELFEDFSQSRIARMEAFSLFIQGISYAELANLYDQAFIVDWDEEILDEAGAAIYPPPIDFSTYQELNEFAIQKLDEAIRITEGNDFILEESWIRGNELTAVEFAALLKAYKVRYMTTVARTPQDREAVDWQTIANLTEDILASGFFQGLSDNVFSVSADGELWWSGPHSLGSDATWARVSYDIIGKTDESGQFED